MKKSLLLALLALSLTSTGALATPGEWIGGLQAGAHVPSSDYGDVAKTGYVAGVFLDCMVNDMFAIGAQVDYNATKAKDEFIVAPIDDIKFTIFNYGAHANLYFMKEGMVRPYVAVTAGAYSAKTKAEGSGVSAEDTQTKFGYGGGVGLHLQPAGAPVGFGVEGMYHNVTDAIEESDGSKKNAGFINVVGKVTFSFSDKSQAH